MTQKTESSKINPMEIDKYNIYRKSKSPSIKSHIVLVWLFCFSTLVDAEIYKWKDATGSVHYFDRYRPDAKTLSINPGYRFYIVKKVFDGDTLELEDGRKIRLLGINTPEVQHREKLADAGGEEAKFWLQNKLQHKKVRLEFDIEKTDKYGRSLAHLFNENKEHINLSLVRRGLASISIYPPNLLYAKELLAAENKAEQEHLGIWQRPEYAVLPVASIAERRHTGWSRVSGKVVTIRNTSKSLYLVLSNQFEARIERKWLSLFPDVNCYLGKTIELRGWINKHKDRYSIFIRHPSAIKQSESC